MKWSLFKHPLGNPGVNGGATVGTSITVYLDSSQRFVRRVYDADGFTVSGKKPVIQSEQALRMLFNNECFWLKKMTCSSRVPLLLDIDEKEMSITQEYLGPDLYTLMAGRKSLPDDLVAQFQDIYLQYRQIGLCKGNVEPRNLGLRGSQIVAFDFKWAKFRTTETVRNEIRNIRHFLTPVDTKLPPVILQTFTDFPELIK